MNEWFRKLNLGRQNLDKVTNMSSDKNLITNCEEVKLGELCQEAKQT